MVKAAEETLLIKHAHAVMTGGSGAAARSDATDLLVQDGVIVQMGRSLAAPASARVLDATDCVVYPGWVNTHHHLFQALLKGIPSGINQTLTPWLAAVPYAYGHRFDGEAIRLAATVGMVELMRSGCTTIADHHYLYFPGMRFDASEILFDVAERLGVRFSLLRGAATRTRSGEASLPDPLEPETLDAVIADMERLAARFNDAGPRPRRRVALAPTTPTFSVASTELKPLAATARRLGIRLHTHLSETVAYIEYCRQVHGMLPVEFMAENDWVGADVFFAHMVHLHEAEMRILAQTGTGIVHCPQSNSRLGSGVAPAPALDRMGVPVSIGVDGAASNEAADMISEAHHCWLVHRSHAGAASRPRPEGAGEAGAAAVTVEDVIRWGSANGARVLGFEGVGEIVAGAAADLAVYSLDDPRYFGLHDTAIGPVASGGRPRLRWLLVDGRIVLEDDVIPGIDMVELGARSREAVTRLIA
jgi:cytosine/adenosine deaminase-related metal-dependent hydrolase